MKDFRGVELKEGDHVVYSWGGRYSGKSLTRVIGFTPKMVRTSRDYPPKYRGENVNPTSLVILARENEKLPE